MVDIMDGLNSLPWIALDPTDNGWRIDLTTLPERDKFKYGYDLWSSGLAFQAFGIGRTYKASIRAPGYGNGVWLFNLDTRGRLVNASYTGTRWGDFDIPAPHREFTFSTLPYPVSYRPEIHRLLGGTWLQATWVDRRDRSRLTYRAEIVQEQDVFYQAAMHTLDKFAFLANDSLLTSGDEAATDVLERLRKLPVKNHGELHAEACEFHSILGVEGLIPVEPPELAFDHYHAIPVKTQQGCGGTCTFCTLYHRSIKVLDTADVMRQIDSMSEYLGEEVDHFVKIVLLEGDVLAVPASTLCEELKYAREKFELRLSPFAHAFAKADTVADKSPAELRALREAGLCYINLGLETGSQELLDVVKPSQRLDVFRDAVWKAREADIKVSVNVIAGLGGRKFIERHVVDTLEFAQGLPSGIEFFCAPLEVYSASVYARQEADLGGRLTEAELARQRDAFERGLGAHEYIFVPM